jgi:hypothetical protein
VVRLAGGHRRLAALCRAEVFYVGPVFALWCAWRTSKFPWRRLRLGAIAIAAMVAVRLPWACATKPPGTAHSDDDQARLQPLQVLPPDDDGRSDGAGGAVPDFGDRRSPTREALLREQGLRFMSQDPPRTLWFMANKLVLLFKLTPSNEVNRSTPW